MKKIKFLLLTIIAISINSCGVYNFTGTGKIDAKTFQVNRFQNNAVLIEPNVDRIFTNKLQERIQNQTNLSLTNSSGDLVYEGEITEYRVEPTSANAGGISSSQNRLVMVINVRFINKKKETDNFEKKFTHFADFAGDKQLTGAVLNTALEEIYTRITQDIFNDSLAKW